MAIMLLLIVTSIEGICKCSQRKSVMAIMLLLIVTSIEGICKCSQRKRVTEITILRIVTNFLESIIDETVWWT